MNKNPFIPIASMAQAQTRIIEALGVPYSDPFNEEGVIADVNDPLKLGRVKVRTDDQITSSWIPVSGSSSGTLSARYIGSQVLVGKRRGRSDDMYVVGLVRSDPGVGINGNPLQLPVIDESMAVWNGSTDPGMSCNEGNQGRVYILSNEMNQDVVVCLRRTSKQVGSKPAWAWKSVTNGLWVEKGVNPGNETTLAIEQGQKRNPGIPECSEALAGEEHEFSEDRGFRTIKMICQRDENKSWGWRPSSAVPTYFRTIQPNCTEKLHGMEALLDDGNNSELLICQRYQGLMKWVKQGQRLPHKFHTLDKPLSRVEFTTIYKPVKALEEEAVPVQNYDWVAGDVAEVVFDATVKNIPLTGTDPVLKTLLQAASLVPGTAFDGADTLQQAAREALSSRTGIPVETLFQTIREELDDNGSLTPETGTVLAGVGAAADVLVNGVVTGDTGSALIQIGQQTLRNALLTLEPRAASVMTGLMSGGIAGAIDSAVAVGLDELPPEVSKYVGPVIDIAQGLLASAYPATLGTILNSSTGGGLLGAVTSTINTAIGANVVSPALLGSVVSGLTTGAFGEIPKLFGSLSNLDAVSKLPPGLGSLPVLATTALGLIGQAESMTKLLGNGGLGIDQLSELVGGGFNAAVTIINGVKGLRGVFGGGEDDDCPCGPKCRKVSHGEDSDGNNILEKCGALTANNSNAYNPSGAPIPNNTGPVAREQGLTDTAVGSELIPSNRADLTKMVEQVSRVKDMAERFNAARFADLPEHMAEMAYTFEAVEKSFKTADNNITGVESIERKLIDSMYNLLTNIVYKKGGGVLPDIINDAKENSQAIRDLYKFVKKLDQVKSGGKAGVRVTGNLANSFANIPGLAALGEKSRAEALKILRGGIIPADREWRSLTPGVDYGSVLGTYGPAIPSPYPSERTLFDRDRILAISAESKLGETSPQPRQLLDSVLSPSQVGILKGTGSVSGVASPLAPGESSIYDAITAREGKTDCE